MHFFVLLFLALMASPCQRAALPDPVPPLPPVAFAEEPVRTGAERTELYFPLLAGKKTGLVVHPSSRLGSRHLVDTLMASGISVARIFAPEHGFRGAADAGEMIKDETDTRTGLRIVSLYGDRKKPRPEDLSGLDVLVFDLQDVGTRFYTYLSTLHYVMEACAENGVEVIVLDRPNPNCHFVDGPVLEPGFRSFVGMHPIPVVHGMTLGELAQMINGEGWLQNGLTCALKVIPCGGYHRQKPYELAVPPSPNLPNMRAVYLYPSLCFFEGTVVSVGRGTDGPFQLYGAPGFPAGSFRFTPQPNLGAKYPPHQGVACSGFDLRSLPPDQVWSKGRIDLGYLLGFYRDYPDKNAFFLANHFIDKLAGTDQLRDQIRKGWTEDQIRASWQEGIGRFLLQRQPYLLYPLSATD